MPSTRQAFRVLLVLSIALAGCTVVKLNPDDTDTITYRGDADVAQDLANRACRKGGQVSAEIIAIANTDTSKPPGTGRQKATFRCSSRVESPAL